MTISRTQQIQQLEQEWTSPRWKNITRPYSAEDVIKLRGSVNPECTFAQNGAKNCGNCCTAGRVKGISTVWGINRWSGATTGESRC